MLIYDKIKLSNLLLSDLLKKWMRMNLLSELQLTELVKTKSPLYQHSNLFLRIGVFALTMILAVCTFGLITIFFGLENLEHAIGFIFIGYSLISFAVLHYFINSKKVFANGIDDALIYFSVITTLEGIIIIDLSNNLGMTETSLSFIFFLILAPVAIYCCDRVLAVGAYAALLAIFFFGIPQWFGMTVAKMMLPFFTMLLSYGCYFYVRKLQLKFEMRYWNNCLKFMEYATLISFYAGGNYFVVRELSTEFFNVELKHGENIPLYWFFYLFTVAVPILYIFSGLKIKSAALINLGLLLCVAAIATIRYYHSIMPIEWALVIGGLVILATAYLAHQYFKTPKHNITREEDQAEDPLFGEDAEAIFMAQILRSSQATPSNDMKFGGGEFGGGGAEGGGF